MNIQNCGTRPGEDIWTTRTSVDDWLDTTRRWQGNLDKASKYWCFGLPGVAQSIMGVAQIIAGVALAIFPGTDITHLVAESRLQGVELAQKGICNLFGGALEAIPLVGTITAIVRILITEKEDRAEERSKQLLRDVFQAAHNDWDALQRQEALVRKLNLDEQWAAHNHSEKKRAIAGPASNAKTMPASVKILLADTRSAEDILRQDGIEAVRLEIEFMDAYTQQRERNQIIQNVPSKKALSEEERLATTSYGVTRETFIEAGREQEPKAASVKIVLADQRSAVKILREDGLDALKLRTEFMNRYIEQYK